MKGRCVVAVYETPNQAEGAYDAILGSGIPADHVRLGTLEQSESSIWEWLFGSEVLEDDRRGYNTQFSRGALALSVLVDAPSVAKIGAVEELMERFHPMNVHEGAMSSADTSATAPTLRGGGTARAP